MALNEGQVSHQLSEFYYTELELKLNFYLFPIHKLTEITLYIFMGITVFLHF